VEQEKAWKQIEQTAERGTVLDLDSDWKHSLVETSASPLDQMLADFSIWKESLLTEEAREKQTFLELLLDTSRLWVI
jgi:hypothetical protein